MTRLFAILLAACAGGHRDAPAAGSASPRSVDAGANALSIPKSGPFTLAKQYTTCLSDDDCIVVSLGCCDATGVNIASSDAVHAALEASGRPHCPPKTACGPAEDGTWNGMPGECSILTGDTPGVYARNDCVVPNLTFQIPKTGAIVLPAGYDSCTKDEECVVLSLGCADATPVNRAHLMVVRRALRASGRAYLPPKDACGPGPKGIWDGQAGACAASRCVVPKWP